ncbi:MAG: IS5 family transposase [Chloroflexota bacterium]|nr:IS5 family transposase [Chloroflexota bacterium]MDE3100661.1 IS5 family transposase [Chloroflexota bacterium]
MRGEDRGPAAMWTYVRLEERVPKDHPLRAIRRMTDAALAKLDRIFDGMYSPIGRPSIPPERLLRALVLQLLYSIRSERLLMERLDHDLLFRWFVGLDIDDPVWDPSTFSQNRDGVLGGEVAQAFLAAVVGQAREAKLLSDEHFSVDGTLIEAWAGHKSFRPIDERTDKGGGSAGGKPGAPGDFKGARRSNTTHRSTTDPDARLYRKGPMQEAKLAYTGHVLTENRCGLAVDGGATKASGTAERDAALALAEGVPRGSTLGADKAYDTAAFVSELRERGITPHVCQNTTKRRSAIDGRTTRHVGYAMSQAARRRGERVNGWLKTIALLRKVRHRGEARVDWVFTFALAVYDLVRLRTLLAERTV